MKLYIIHGWTYTIKPWEKTVEILRKNGLEVEMLNVPGLTTESKKVWSTDDYVEWAKRELPNNCVVLGHSNGGRILLNLARKYPDKVRHLILLNSAGIYRKSMKKEIIRKVAKVFAPLKKIWLLRKVFHKIVGASDYSRAPKNMQETLTNMLNSDRKLVLDGIKTETTILWGEEDKITKLEDGREMHKRLENSWMRAVAKWGHAPYITHPAGLAEEILKIVGRLS